MKKNYEDLHPCFSSDSVKKFGRVHLPVAESCNIQCNYCSREFDCVNESRPGVTSTLMSPDDAAYYYKTLREQNPWLTVAGIAGPGDSLANPEKTMETFRLIRREVPEAVFCISTNGLKLPEHIDELYELGLRHLTVTVNAVDPEIGALIYSRISWEGRVYRGREAAEILLNAQKKSIRRAAQLGMSVKVNTIILPGINDQHIAQVSRLARELGATYQNCLPVIPVATTPFEHLPAPDAAMIRTVRAEADKSLPQMLHCGRCRSDAVGRIGEKNSEEVRKFQKYVTKGGRGKALPVVRYAVASHEGLLVNQHLGEARRIYIFETDDRSVRFLEQRIAPRGGAGDRRWKDVAHLLQDCEALFVSACGDTPEAVLNENGLKVFQVQGLIEEILEEYREGRSITRFARKGGGCGSGCSGKAVGCM